MLTRGRRLFVCVGGWPVWLSCVIDCDSLFGVVEVMVLEKFLTKVRQDIHVQRRVWVIIGQQPKFVTNDG